MSVITSQPSAYSRRFLQTLSSPWLVDSCLLFLIVTGFWWKLVLTGEYTWLWSPDLVNQVLPWYQFQAGELHRGRLPLWDPYHWFGQPMMGQVITGTAYPLNWLLFSLPLDNGWIRQTYLHWYFVLIHFLGALFAYLLCRDLGRSRAASILGGIVFACCGFLGTTDWPQMMNGAIWAPLVFLFLLRALRGYRPIASAALSGMFLGISWLSGHHQIPIFISLATAAVWLYALVRTRRFDWQVARLAVIWGVILALTAGLQVIPAYEYGRLAKRWIGLDQPVGWDDPVPYVVHARYSLGLRSLFGIVFPGQHSFTNPFVGVTAVSLAFLAVVTAWSYATTRVFTAIAIAGLLLSLGHNNVIHGVLYAMVPMVDKARSPGMAILLFHLAAAVLAAIGADSLMSGSEPRWRRRIAIALGCLAAVVGATWFVMSVVRPQPLPDDRILMPALIALLLAPILVYGAREPGVSRMAVLAVSVLVLIEAANVSGYWMPSRFETSRPHLLTAMSQNADIAQFLKEQPGPFRFEVDSAAIPFNFGDWHGLEMSGGFLASLTENLTRHDMYSDRMARLFNVRYSVGKEANRSGQREVFTGASGLKVFENAGVLPRVWTVHHVTAVRGPQDVDAFLRDPGKDLRSTALIVAPSEAVARLDRCSGDENVEIIRRDINSITMHAPMNCKGLVVLSDTWFPGWHATVDGKEAPIHEVFGMMRGVVVDAGSHVITIHYRPWSVLLGAMMTAVGVLAALVLARTGRVRDTMSPLPNS